jgi:phage tail sheath protein FI
VLDAQRALLRRCAPDRWRVALLLAAPARREDATGAWGPPNARQAIAWRQSLRQGFDESSLSCAALYHPWALTRERLGSPIAVLPPTPLAAGLLARRDLARGPHVAPANETLVGVVGLAPPPTEADNTALHAVAINPLRVKPGQGIQIWGARTLSEERWMRYLSVRRCLSAIERRALAALRPLVFEPISPTLWFQVTQAMLGLLVPIFNAGALRGDTAEEAFYVRCDDTNNESARLLAGEVLCEVGVAIAAPAEFIVFRLARRSSVVEVLE